MTTYTAQRNTALSQAAVNARIVAMACDADRADREWLRDVPLAHLETRGYRAMALEGEWR